MIALHRPQHLHGTVNDAETGRPIERFVLIPGWGPVRPGSRPSWLRGEPSARTLAGGEFDLTDGLFPDQGFRRSIRIEADGYLPAELLGFLYTDEQKSAWYDAYRKTPDLPTCELRRFGANSSLRRPIPGISASAWHFAWILSKRRSAAVGSSAAMKSVISSRSFAASGVSR